MISNSEKHNFKIPEPEGKSIKMTLLKGKALLSAGSIILTAGTALIALTLFSCEPSHPPEVAVKQETAGGTQNETKSEIQIRAEKLLSRANRLKEQAEIKEAPLNDLAFPFYENGNTYLRAAKSKIVHKDYLNAIPLLEKSIKNYQIAIEATEFNEEQFNNYIKKAKRNLEAIKEKFEESGMAWERTSELKSYIHRAEYLFRNNEFARAQKQAKNAYELSENMKSQISDFINTANEAKRLLAKTHLAKAEQKYNQEREYLERFVPYYALKIKTALSQASSHYENGQYDDAINKAREADSLLNFAIEKMQPFKVKYLKILDNLNKTEANINEAITKYNANETVPELVNETWRVYHQAKTQLEHSLDKALSTSNHAFILSETLLKEARSRSLQAHSYTVRKGDCLWKIAQKIYGDPTMWKAIYKLNKDKIKDPNRIYPNQVFELPPEHSEK